MGSLPLLIFLLSGSQELQPPPDPPPPTTQPSNSADAPITGLGRLEWTVKSTIGPASLYTGILSSTWGTAFDHPREYGESFDGWAKRYGLRLSGVASSNVAEATLGFIWREDPRYHRDPVEESFRKRFHHTLFMTFMSDRNGHMFPAYARYIAIAGTNVLSDSWRPNTDRGPVNTIDRIGLGFGGRLLGNMYEEFWPDVRRHMPFFKH